MKIDRRHFIKSGIVAGTFVMGGGPLLSSCGGVRRVDLHASDPSAEVAENLDPTGLAILQYAAMAPSGHNSQPWTVKGITPREWIVGADPARIGDHLAVG